MVALLIPEPGTSDARCARWLGFAADCDCHVADNNGENPASDHVIHPDCALHRGWTSGDTFEVAEPRWGGFSVVPPEHADAHAQWMAANT